MKLRDYIQGKRRGKEANALERKSLNDSFLQDAIDGFDAVEGEHWPAIEALGKLVDERTGNKKTQRFGRRQWIAIAASFVLLIGMGSLLYWTLGRDEPMIAMKSESVDKPPEKQEQEIIISEKRRTPEPVRQPQQSQQPPEIPKTETKIKTDENAKIVEDESLDAEISLEESGDELSMIADMVAPVREQKSDVRAEPLKIEVEEMQRQEDVLKESSVKQRIAEKKREIADEKVSSAAYLKEQPIMQDSRENVISGFVFDKEGKSLPGVSISIKETNNGTVSDIDGHFKLNIKDDSATLKISFIGFQTQEIEVAVPDELNVIMKEDGTELGEIVVVAFGAQKKESVVGSIVSRFEEKEFIEYFEKNREKDICSDKPAFVQLRFSINENGKPVEIDIRKSNCKELEDEAVRLLESSPQWTVESQKIRLKLEIE